MSHVTAQCVEGAAAEKTRNSVYARTWCCTQTQFFKELNGRYSREVIWEERRQELIFISDVSII